MNSRAGSRPGTHNFDMSLYIYRSDTGLFLWLPLLSTQRCFGRQCLYYIRTGLPPGNNLYDITISLLLSPLMKYLSESTTASFHLINLVASHIFIGSNKGREKGFGFLI